MSKQKLNKKLLKRIEQKSKERFNENYKKILAQVEIDIPNTDDKTREAVAYNISYLILDGTLK